jgi:murein DD-endopeptidase MepM/ murein hydrolase activator NlpD
MYRLAFALATTLAALPFAPGPFATLAAAAGDPPRLLWPVDCVPGQSCWLVGYVDHGPPGVPMDYACGRRTRPGQTITEVAVGDMIAVARGIRVLAAAAGTVAHVRNGMPDGGYLADRASVKDRECGNGVVLDHGGGWQTWYCHLRADSIAVQLGQAVTAGQRIAMAGMSGRAEFPVLSFEVRQGRDAVDPFLGRGAMKTCGSGTDPLWAEPIRPALTYRGADITAAGFSDVKPSALTVDYGAAGKDTLPSQAPAMLLWTRIHGARKGDEITLRIDGPDGQPFTQDVATLTQDRSVLTRFAGIERRLAAWPSGQYRGTVIIRRAGPDGMSQFERQTSVTVR